MIEKLKIQQMINQQELEKIRLLEKYDKKIDPIENEKILQQEINRISQFTKKKGFLVFFIFLRENVTE